MSGWAPKRFWTSAQALACDGGFTILLDDRPVRTPAKRPFVVPSLALAAAIATEWDAQHGVIKPDTMPLTRAANSALDKVALLFDGVVDEIANYGSTDLLCYRAVDPPALIARQAAGWDPVLNWARETLNVTLDVTHGVIPIPQPPQSLRTLRQEVAGYTSFQLVALHDLVAISGSLILGLAVMRGHLDPDSAFLLSRIDESWQSELWGVDEDAAALEGLRREAYRSAGRFLALCG